MMEFNHAFLRGILGTIVFLGALFAMNGIVANDRKQGFYRFLFAKPMTPSRYYGQAFFVHWAGFVAVMIVLGLVYGALIWPVLSRPLLRRDRADVRRVLGDRVPALGGGAMGLDVARRRVGGGDLPLGALRRVDASARQAALPAAAAASSPTTCMRRCRGAPMYASGLRS